MSRADVELASEAEWKSISHRPYQPAGAAKQVLYCRAPEVLLSGPAGTGKSRGCIEKIHLCCEKYAGCRWLMVRKTRESLTESALVTLEEKVIPAGHPALTGASRRMRQSYNYPNGSSIVVGGLDKSSKVMSTEYDGVYVQEAIELAEQDWEALTTRLRNGVMPYNQLIADTNPDAPLHWLKRRCDAGRALLLESRHEDNPVLWDAARKDWTEAGRKYIAKLDALTGARLQRLRHGRWVQAEGVVYEGWDASLHIVDPFPMPQSWPRYWSVDFGWTNPFVCQWWALDPDGRAYRYREIYKTHRLVEDHAKDMLRLSGAWDQAASRPRWLDTSEPMPRAIITDHDAEGRQTLHKHLGLVTKLAYKEKQPGIQAVMARLQKAGDGRPRLFLFRGALVERDTDLVEAKKPTCTEEEVDGYVWDLEHGKNKGEEPIDVNNHGVDGMRYFVADLDCALPLIGSVQSVPRNDLVQGRAVGGSDGQVGGIGVSASEPGRYDHSGGLRDVTAGRHPVRPPASQLGAMRRRKA